tara:strand:- start:1993 stop:2571 length:579 start_codon:yes stop_codon:yes gene_type:complete
MNEDAPTMSTATAGGAGFSHKAAATGPNAGIDPIMNFKKKVQKRKKMKEDNEIDRPITVDRQVPCGRSRLFQYRVKIPKGDIDTIIYANNPAELRQKLRLLVNYRYRGDISIERIMPGEAGKFFMDKRSKHMKNVNESDDKKQQQAIVQQKTALEKKKVMIKKMALQKQLQSKVQDMKKKARVGGVKGEADT